MRGESTPRWAPPGPAGPFGKSGGGQEGWSPPPDVCPSVPCPHTAGRLPGRRASCSLQDDPLGKGDSAEERGGGWTEPNPLLAARRRRGRARREQVSAVAGLVVVTASTPCADRDTAGPVSRRARGLRAARSERWLCVSFGRRGGRADRRGGRPPGPGESGPWARAPCAFHARRHARRL